MKVLLEKRKLIPCVNICLDTCLLQYVPFPFVKQVQMSLC